MSHEQAPNPSQEEMQAAIAGAREASQAVDRQDIDYVNGQREEFLSADNAFRGPNVVVKQNGALYDERVDARNRVKSPTTSSEYHAYVMDGGYDDNTGAAIVRRYDRETGDKLYEHRFKNSDTARKFGTLIAKQITARTQETPTDKAA